MNRAAACALLLSALAGRTICAVEPVTFSREVLPLLSDNCLSCHGPDEKRRKADLRLDTREGALAALKPGRPDESELIKRVLSDDPEELMPPPKSHKVRLSGDQVAMLRRWIAEGAPWGKHWAFEKPVQVKLADAAVHPVDALVQASLAKEGLALAPAAPRHTLARRLSFDLTGLPPTPDEVAAFENDRSPDACAKVVKRLLDSPHFGERMAMWWLDAARYSDTDGFQADATRTNWPWRDYVVASFNANKPFSRFTLEQFAGDLLPGATPEQKLATCFHRNHMTNGEGGRDKEESRIDYVIDRVNTTGTVWLGLTLGCAQCHSHKFDPVTQADYYGMSAFFNSIDEDGAAGRNAKPYLSYQSPLAKRAVAEAQALVDQRKPVEEKAREEAQAPFAAWLAAKSDEVRNGYAAWRVLMGRVESQEGTRLNQAPDGAVRATGANPVQDDYRLTTSVALPRVTGFKLEVLPDKGRLSRGKSGEFILTDIKVQVITKGSSQVRELKVADAVADFSADKKKNNNYGDVRDTLDDDPRNGWTTKGAKGTKAHTAVFAFAQAYVPASDEELVIELRHRSTLGDANIARFRLSVTDQAGAAVRSLEAAPLEQLAAAKLPELSKLEAGLRGRLLDQFLEDHAPYQAAKASLGRATAQLKEATTAAGKVEVMVLSERKEARETNILVRGVWDKKGAAVRQDVPAAIAPWPEGSPRSRLGLAQWLTSPENPLTARVVVNHLWQMCFGAGLVRTPEDFGLQGQRPTHPEVLDWLAVDFMEHGWDVKHLLTRIVTSATYQQDSAASAELIARDPQNRLLARGARFRLPSWMLRDAALRDAGLINPALGGPPVRPYQPEGVWEENFMGRFTYEPSEGAAQYRRTLYAFWRRSIAPTFLFDAAQRRTCDVGVSRTNTPLQALTLLNDGTMMEASRTLAAQMLRRTDDPVSRLRFLFERVLSREPQERETVVLRRELDRALAHYRAHPDDAASYLSSPATDGSLPELAALTVVASLVLNLDEALTHE
jgi:hypothetical protein